MIQSLILTLFVNEKLVRFLLIHNQVLATYHCQKVIILRHLHTDDFIRLSGLSFQEWNGNLAGFNLLVGVHIKELYLVNFRNHKGVDGLDLQSA